MAAKSLLTFKLITPVETVFEKEVEQVIVPTEAGQITVLPNHSLLVSILQPGELILKFEEDEQAVAVSGGVIEMFDNTLVVLADSAIQPSDIDIESAEQQAKQLAQEISEQTDLDLSTYEQLLNRLRHEQAKLQVGTKWRK